MFNNILRIVLVGVSVLILGATLWVNWETNVSNKLVEESGAASSTGDAFTKEGGAKIKDLFSEANLLGFPKNRATLEEPAQEAADLLGKAAEQYRLAATKLEEAAKNPVDKIVTEYWGLKAQAYHKIAESKDVYRRMVLLPRDGTLETSKQLLEQIGTLGKEADELSKAFDGLNVDADKIKTEHKEKFN